MENPLAFQQTEKVLFTLLVVLMKHHQDTHNTIQKCNFCIWFKVFQMNLNHVNQIK